MNEPINCFILSAGLGERLKPITNYIPKPLIPILGKPALQHVIERVAEISPINIGINLHYKKEMILYWLSDNNMFDSYRITTFQEEQLLGTGGALKNAEAFLKDNYFLVYNSDIFSDIDIERLIKYHLYSNNIATLAVHDCPEYNNLEIDEDGFLKSIKPNETTPSSKLCAFTGIAIYSPDFLKFLPKGFSSVVFGWMNAISFGAKIACLYFKDHHWNDIGTVNSYVSAIIKTLKSDGEKIYIHPANKHLQDIELNGYIVIENDCNIKNGVSLKNCILLPNSYVEVAKHENCILGNSFKIQLDEKIFTGNSSMDYIGYGGSDRKYFRINKEGKSHIFMQTNNSDQDFHRQIQLTTFFNHYDIPAPKLIAVDFQKFQATFEDLGDISLYSWLKMPRPLEDIESIYKKVLDCLLLIHIKAARHISEYPEINLRIFDYEHLRWESEYFLRRFVFDLKNIEPKDIDSIYKEFHELALEIDSFQKGLMHRDFQSQNIMITHGGVVRIIDYQGARIGPQAYDVASILWDPYYRLDDSMRDRLLAYYINKLSYEMAGKLDFSADKFLQNLLLCRLQRHMQALGAYGFLSKVKCKRFFLKYIPEGLRLLKEDTFILKHKYPALYNLTLII